MVSVRKKYRPESAAADREFPVQTAPSVSAEQPSPASDKQEPELPERLVESDPVKEAEHEAIALQQRLREMERAETLASEALTLQQRLAAEAQQQQRAPTTEEIIANSGLPDRVQDWLRQHPEYIRDPRKNTSLQHYHNQMVDAGIGQFTDAYFDRMESLLGLKPSMNGNGQLYDRPPMAAPTPAPRNPPRQQTYGGVPVSVPPHRDIPSMSSGRPMSSRAPLTAAEAEIARSLGISAEEYQQQKQKMERLKAAGVIQDGR